LWSVGPQTNLQINGGGFENPPITVLVGQPLHICPSVCFRGVRNPFLTLINLIGSYFPVKPPLSSLINFSAFFKKLEIPLDRFFF
jgi:hypothetical protein